MADGEVGLAAGSREVAIETDKTEIVDSLFSIGCAEVIGVVANESREVDLLFSFGAEGD